MGRFNLLFLLFVVCLLSCALLDVEAKSREKGKEKSTKKYKTEGKPKEAKYRYSQETEKYSKKFKKQQEENTEPINEEEEPVENEKLPDTTQKSFKQKKEKKPYTISVELVEEPESEINPTRDQSNGKINFEDNIESRVQNENKEKTKKKQGSQGAKKIQSPKNVIEDTADFIVHVPKNKKGKRQVLVFQVPAQDSEAIEGEETENAVQQYVADDQDIIVEEDCGCEENIGEEQSIPDKRSSNMCYY